MEFDAELPRFAPGDVVQVRSNRALIGTVVREPVRANGDYWYLVRLANGHEQRFCEEALEPFVKQVSVEGLFAGRAFGDAADFLRLVTFQKLSAPLDNALYAAHASRTDFYAHQYKPLIKFLDSTRQRLLIADEVGLGKTIEAGLIMIELRARGLLDAALVVCPSVLRQKWREEMWRRFDEEFRILDSAGVRRLLDVWEEHERLTERRAIISLETIRHESLLERLEGNPLPWDLVVFDEAHHLRNSETSSHQAATTLCDAAASVVMLTATPIQLGDENLFQLLKLLDPTEFSDYDPFRERLEANAPVIEAQRIATAGFPPDMAAIRERLQLLRSGRAGRFFADNPLFQRVLADALGSGPLTRDRVATLAEDLKDLNLVGHIFTRTRKREVMARMVERVSTVIRDDMAPAEKRFYHAVTRFVRSRSGQNLYFGAVSAQRQVASCMQAAKYTYLKQALEAPPEDEASDASDLLIFDDKELVTPLDPSAELIAAATALGDTDTKYRRLVELLHKLEREEPGRPVIVFAFFRGTLEYLRHRLSADGFSCNLIHGGVPSDPGGANDVRGATIRAFREGQFRILLSSEVGSEGLDFQFCHVLVNYDLPWNPMRVEQRIGRLDRLGQQSDRVLIFSLSLVGTIEDRILERLYLRIGIFERSLGDLEAILGAEIRELTRDLLTRHLTPEQEEARIEHAASVLEQRMVDLQRLERESARLLGTDEYFEEQLDRALKGGETLAPADVEVFFARFLDVRYPGARLSAERPGVHRLRPDFSLEQAIHRMPEGAARLRLLRQINEHDIVRITFDPACARESEDLELVTGQHPLLRLAVSHYRQHDEELHPVSAVGVTAPDDIPAGQYLYLLEEIEITGARKLRRLEPFFIDVDGGDPLDERASSALYGLMLRASGDAVALPEFTEESGRKAFTHADDRFCERLAARSEAARERAAALLNTRLTSLRLGYENRKRRLQERIAAMGNEKVRGRRLLEAQLRKEEQRYAARIAEVNSDGELQMSSRVLGAGLVNVVSALS